MNTSLTVTEAARNFAEVVNRAYYRSESTILLKNGKPVAQIVPAPSSPKSAREFAAQLEGERPRLSPGEARSFETALHKARQTVSTPKSPWG